MLQPLPTSQKAQRVCTVRTDVLVLFALTIEPNKTHNVHTKVTLRRVRVTVFVVEK